MDRAPPQAPLDGPPHSPASPVGAPWTALERPGQIGRNPSAVKIALLPLHSLFADEARVHPTRIEREMVAEQSVPLPRRRIAPRRRSRDPFAHPQIPISCLALELAKAAHRDPSQQRDLH